MKIKMKLMNNLKFPFASLPTCWPDHSSNPHYLLLHPYWPWPGSPLVDFSSLQPFALGPTSSLEKISRKSSLMKLRYHLIPGPLISWTFNFHWETITISFSPACLDPPAKRIASIRLARLSSTATAGRLTTGGRLTTATGPESDPNIIKKKWIIYNNNYDWEAFSSFLLLNPNSPGSSTCCGKTGFGSSAIGSGRTGMEGGASVGGRGRGGRSCFTSSTGKEAERRTAGSTVFGLDQDLSSKNGISGKSARSLAKAKFWAIPGRSGSTSGSSKSGKSPRSWKDTL